MAIKHSHKREMHVFQTLRAKNVTVFGIDWSPAGYQLATGWEDGVRVWDVPSATVQHFFGSHSAIFSIAWSPDGSHLVCGDARGRIVLYDTVEWKELGVGTHHQKGVVYLAWSPDSRLFVSGAQDNNIAVWDGLSAEMRRVIRRHKSPVYGLSWSPNTNLFASGTHDKDVVIWNGDTGELVRTLAPASGPITNLSWSPDGRYLAAGVDHSAVQIWNPESGRLVYELEGHSSSMLYVQFSPDGKLFASKSKDGCLRIWRVDSWETIFVFRGKAGNTHGRLRFCPTRSLFAARDDNDKVVRIWEFDGDAWTRRTAAQATTQYTSAKIVFVGESNVGKSCLAMRLAEDRFPEDHERRTTHGMRFWPIEAGVLHPAAKPPAGQRRDVVLWDFGGQVEYQLVHQMFLNDTTLALIVIDPTRGQNALDEARNWNKRLEKHFGEQRSVKLLVGGAGR